MAFGGGLELAMMCDVLMASEDAKLGQPEIKLGIIPGAGGTVRLTQAVGKSKSMEMILTGEPITAQDALQWRLVSKVCPKDKLLDEAIKLGQKISNHSGIATSFAKRAIRQSFELGESSAIDHERTLFIAMMNTHDKVEGVNAFL